MIKFYLKPVKGIFVFIASIGFSFVAQAQYFPCANLDFSSGTFTNWTGYTSVYPFDTPGTNITNPANGIDPPTNYYYTQGIVSGRHTIITTAAPDPFTCGNVMTLPPGEKQCVRLGNGGKGSWGNGVAWQREFLTYDIAVSPSNSLLIYKYAAVLQDSPIEPSGINNHTKSLRPRFIVSITNSQDKQIDSMCYQNGIFSDSTLKFLHACNIDTAKKMGGDPLSEGNIVYTDWRTVGLDLRPYIGQTIRLKFETWDCGLGGHFGYAYLTAKCGEMKINANACTPGSPVKLTAPEGFSYKWLPSGETTQSIIINNAKLGDSITVEMTSINGCKTILKRMVFQYPTADFEAPAKTCIDNPTQFTDRTGSLTTKWKWTFGDGTTDVVRNPIHTYKTTGTYMVSLTVTNEAGCTDSTGKSIYVCPDAGIHDAVKKLNVHAYPNPSTGAFKLEVGEANIGTVQVAISNVLGQVVYSENNAVKNGLLQKDLDIKEQPDGIYFVTVQNEEYRAVVKLVKKN